MAPARDLRQAAVGPPAERKHNAHARGLLPDQPEALQSRPRPQAGTGDEHVRRPVVLDSSPTFRTESACGARSSGAAERSSATCWICWRPSLTFDRGRGSLDSLTPLSSCGLGRSRLQIGSAKMLKKSRPGACTCSRGSLCRPTFG